MGHQSCVWTRVSDIDVGKKKIDNGFETVVKKYKKGYKGVV